MDKGAWSTTVHKVPKSWRQLKQLSTLAHMDASPPPSVLEPVRTLCFLQPVHSPLLPSPLLNQEWLLNCSGMQPALATVKVSVTFVQSQMKSESVSH